MRTNTCLRSRATSSTTAISTNSSSLKYDTLEQKSRITLCKKDGLIERPDYIFIAAAKVGGIQANNQFRADFLFGNLQLECNLIHGAISRA